MPESASSHLSIQSLGDEGTVSFFSLGVKETSDKAYLSPKLIPAASVKGLRTELFSGGS